VVFTAQIFSDTLINLPIFPFPSYVHTCEASILSINFFPLVLNFPQTLLYVRKFSYRTVIFLIRHNFLHFLLKSQYKSLLFFASIATEETLKLQFCYLKTIETYGCKRSSIRVCIISGVLLIMSYIPPDSCPILEKYPTTFFTGGSAVAYWVRHYATNRQVEGSIPDGVTGIF
jgi:hypothetical protein